MFIDMFRLVVISALFVMLPELKAAPSGSQPGPGGPGSGSGDPDSNNEYTLSGSQNLIAYVSKKGASIRVYRNTTDTTDKGKGRKTGEITIELDTIEELNSTLGQLNGSTINSFNNLDFNVTFRNDVQLPRSNPPITANCLDCTAILDKQSTGKGATVELSVCAILGNGTLDMNGELTSLIDGQLKVTFSLSDWKWNASTNKLAVDISIRVPSGGGVNSSSSGSANKPNTYSLGVDSFVQFSRMVYADDLTWQTMPDGYPKLTTNGTSNHVMIILDHFNTSSAYDPNLEVGYEYTEYVIDTESGANSQCSVPRLMSVALLAVLSIILTAAL